MGLRIIQSISVKKYLQQHIERIGCQLEEARTKSEIAEKKSEELSKKYKAETESLKADFQAKVQKLNNENTSFLAEVKRLTDELDQEKRNKNREYFARMRSENAKKNFEELFKKKSAEAESLRADLEAKIVKNDNYESQLQVSYHHYDYPLNLLFFIGKGG